MKVSISYNELHDYVKSEFKKDVTVAFVDEKTVKITYRQKMLMATVPLSVNLKIVEVTSGTVTAQYNGGTGVDLIIAGVLHLVKEKLLERFNAEEAVSIEKDRRIRIDFRKIKKAKSVFEKLSLEDINFSESRMEVSLRAVLKIQ